MDHQQIQINTNTNANINTNAEKDIPTSPSFRGFIDTDALLFAVILGKILKKIAFKDINEQQFFFFYNKLIS